MHNGDQPLVSVVMSNYNGAAYLATAVASVLNQSHRAIELIVVDDASDDESPDILQRLASNEPRLKPILSATNTGPAGARNIGLDAAQGQWVAIIDADDLIHPQRIERLLNAAKHTKATVIADDLMCFGAVETAGQTLLSNLGLDRPTQITLSNLALSDSGSAGFVSLGYLKPLIRRDALQSLRYDESLRVGEDFDLYFRLLSSGVSFWVIPDPTYLYRRHSASVSHRLSVPVLNKLLSAHDAASEPALAQRSGDTELQDALGKRQSALKRALSYQQLVADMKSRNYRGILTRLSKRPALIADLVASVADRGRRSRSLALQDKAKSPRALVLTAPNRVNAVQAPQGAVRQAVDAYLDPDDIDWLQRRAMARRIVALTSRRPVDVIAEGPEGQDALGYLPEWRSASLRLSPTDTRYETSRKNTKLEFRLAAD